MNNAAIMREASKLRTALNYVFNPRLRKKAHTDVIAFRNAAGKITKKIVCYPGWVVKKVPLSTPHKVELIDKLDFLLDKIRFKVPVGGRAGGKTRNIAMVLVEVMRIQKFDIMCCREVQKSIRASSHKVLKNYIEERGLDQEFDVNLYNIVHRQTRAEITFWGLRGDASAIKSAEAIDIVWIDESQAISVWAYETLEPTIRKHGSQVIISMNPRFEDDIIYEEYVTPYLDKLKKGRFKEKGFCLQFINYTDNYWISDVSLASAERKKRLNFKRYLHIWEGELYQNDQELIKQEWWQYHDPDDFLKHVTRWFITGDTAYTEKKANDPSVFILWGCVGKKYMMPLAMLRGWWEFPELIKEFKKFYTKNVKHPRLSSAMCYVEAKASGLSVVQTLRKAGLLVRGWIPGDWNFSADKVGRVHDSQELIAYHYVLLPKTDKIGYEWVTPFVRECSQFSADDSHHHDDQVDNLTMACSIFRRWARGGTLK